MNVTTAVFPVAGLGTRFLPATKANPKEMLPIVDKPLIQYAVEEALAAGITQLVFVTSSSKRAIEDHFDSNYELEDRLRKAAKQEDIHLIKEILPSGVSAVYVRQPEPLGLGHAVLCASPVVGDKPFAVLLADDLLEEATCLSKMVQHFNQQHHAVVAVESIPEQHTQRYGIVAPVGTLKEATATECFRLRAIVEKPEPAQAPSRLAVVGRYVLPARIFEHLRGLSQGRGGEIQLTDAIASLIQEQPVYAQMLQGKRYDCGSKLGYLQATCIYGLKHAEIGADFQMYLRELAQSLPGDA